MAFVPVTVLTPSIPGREAQLVEAIASVNAQTVQADAHLIRVQTPPGPLGPVHIAAQRNALLDAVTTDWVATLDDDDLWLPHHLATVAPYLRTADLVYTWPTPEWAIHRLDCTGWDHRILEARLRNGNFIPSSALIRTGLLRRVGGWQTTGYDGRFETGAFWEDHDLWIRLARMAATFVCVPEETWVYRMDGEWTHAQAGGGPERDRR